MTDNSGRAYRAILWLYPPSVRRTFGDEMLDFVQHRIAHEVKAGKPWARSRAWAFLLRDALKALPKAYFESVFAVFGRGPDGHRPEGMSIMEKVRLVISDLRYAMRGLLRTPGFTAVAVITLALGIGANTAMFSVVNGIILKPLPFIHPERLIQISASNLETGSTGGAMSQPDIQDLQSDSRTLAAAAGYSATSLTLTGGDEPQLIRAGRVTNGLLAVLEAPPVLGRDIRPEENVPNGPRVVVISHSLWQDRFGGEPDVLGKTIELSERSFEIVGVAPAGFNFPGASQIWLPRYLNTEGCGRGCHLYAVIARIEASATLAEVRQDISAMALRLEEAYPENNYRKGFHAELLSETVYGDVKTGLLVLLGSVGMVLLIACANVANLLMVRGAARTGEVAVRAALGAGRGRLVTQLLSESLLLAALGGVVGLALAKGGIALLLKIAPATLPRTDQIGLDGTVLLFTVGAVLAVTVVFGLLPALRLSRVSVSGVLNRSGRGGVGAPTQDWSRSLLLASEVALSLMLLFGTGLLLKSFAEMNSVRLGFDKESVLTFTLSIPETRYPESQQEVQFYQDLEDRLWRIPAVESVGSVFGSPMGGARIGTGIEFLDRPKPPPGQDEVNTIRIVTPNYLETLRIPLLRGRMFERLDNEDGQRVAIVSESFAKKYYEGDNAIGKQIELSLSFGMDEVARTIVGVVGDIRSQRLTREPFPEVYVPHAQMAGGYMTIVARLAPGTRDPVPAIKHEVAIADANLALRRVERLEEAVERSMGPAKFYLTLLAVFAAVAVTLALVGLYGVVTYVVSRRKREIGIRIALGAHGRDVVRMVLVQGLKPATIGIVLGLFGSYWGARVIASLLYNVKPLDATTFATVTMALLAVVTLATLIPARRASRIEPAEALRIE